MVKVKICGITNLEDAEAAVDMGADLLGFNFYPESKRYISSAQAAGIIEELPTFVDIAGIFVNATVGHIKEVTEQCFLNWIQLHGDETPDFCESIFTGGIKTIKAIRVRSDSDIEKVEGYFTDAVLFDGYDPANYGGTGKAFDWEMISQVDKRVFLAGGIGPANAASAVETGVYGIDICSGVEKEPGKKDHEKMKRLFENIEHIRG
ncbi:MAG: phosphoribosylanthranilate isomerase [Planctomycetota bacterium]|jgi:phosphoribosylanthranilate isomerase